ncbi:hypothetical protein HNR23_001081 [Nocardiopsis mwathae]|uniref:ARB-07466-like C-terminal domain-containing protein n=1 Tax=Nocardiopsis mwathae TaxID=1472723 RepID=A0A7X0D4Q3_9ACTN|nr:hypothetical protein [Nocardiopsis mwathae]
MEPDRPFGPDDFPDFWAPDPRVGPALLPAAARRRLRLSLPALALAGTLGLAPMAPSASAAPAEESLSSLQERAEALGEEYGGHLIDMEGVIEEAERAEKRAEGTKEEVGTAQAQVRQLAVASYTQGGVDPAFSLFVDDDPQRVIDQASLVGHLSSSQRDKIERLERAIDRDRKAKENAEGKAAKVQEDLDELEERREKVQELIAKHPVQEMGPPDNLTPRTRQMKEVIIEKFGEGRAQGGVGCYRPDGGWVVGEHPKGRACDFMVNNEGRMPTQENIDRGYEISKFAQDNAERLGIMYIIYRQKIWDVRRAGEGWRDMADRGSITENHFDHVHISMF